MTPTCPTCGPPEAITVSDDGLIRVRIRRCPACTPAMGGWSQDDPQSAPDVPCGDTDDCDGPDASDDAE